MHYVYLFFIALIEFISRNWIMIFMILFGILQFVLPVVILFRVLKVDEKNCKMKREEHEKEMELKQVQIDYYNSHFGKDA